MNKIKRDIMMEELNSIVDDVAALREIAGNLMDSVHELKAFIEGDPTDPE